MSKLYSRAEFRDRVRRKLNIVPPIDIIGLGAAAGDQPTNSPWPTNQAINDALQDAIGDVNRECQFHVSQFSVPVNAVSSTTYGPFHLDLSNLAPSSLTGSLVSPTALINDVLRVLWIGSGGIPQIVTPANRNALDRNAVSSYYATLPAVPQQWYVEQYKLYLTPAQAEAGTYQLTCGTGIAGLQCEGDVLDEVPIDFQTIFEDRAVFRLSITQTQDVEAQERAQSYGALSMVGIKQFKDWREGGSGTPQAGLAFVSYRTGYGTRRVVR